jgi:hypothetical protein
LRAFHAVGAIEDSADRKNAYGGDAVAFALLGRDAATADGAAGAAAVPMEKRCVARLDDEGVGFDGKAPAITARKDYQKIGFITPA